MAAINSALEIDLSGQICADSIGHKVYSGIGGYVDFMHGASSAFKGKTIIVLPSTSSDGRKSRIVSHLTSGAGVVSSRSNVRYIVTEFGIAYLHGKTIRERALALINIAHPRFRERLLAEAKQLHYVYDDQVLPAIYEPLYPGRWETHQIFPGDLSVFFRPIKQTDERALQEFFYSLPDQDIYYRFLSAMKGFPHRNTQGMCNIDYEHEMAIVGVTGEIGNERIIAVGRYMLDQKTNMAEADLPSPPAGSARESAPSSSTTCAKLQKATESAALRHTSFPPTGACSRCSIPWATSCIRCLMRASMR